MPDRIDATEHPTEAARRKPAVNRPRAAAHGQQLRSGYHAVLSASQLGKGEIATVLGRLASLSQTTVFGV